jgi:hypothetical protein
VRDDTAVTAGAGGWPRFSAFAASAVLLIVVATVSCERAESQEPEPPTPATDTMTTAMRGALDRFRTTIQGTPPTRTAGGASDRNDLISRFVDAVQRADTAALIAMTMTRAEFAYLYYPSSVYTHPPYALDAEYVWLLTKSNTEKGLTRIMQRFAGQTLHVTAHRCNEQPKQEGPNRYWDGCVLTTAIAGASPTMRWFGTIWERGGHFKFVSYANDL